MSIFATDFVIDNAAGLAIGGVVGVAAKGVLKGLTFAGRRVGGKIAGLVSRRGIVAMAGEKAAQAEFERSFAQSELEKVYGTPKENHAGVRSEDPNREVGAATKKKLISTAEVGKKAEEQAVKDLKAQGFDKTYTIQNASGNGVDVVGVNSQTGAVKGLEVKGNSAGLSDAQAEMGGEKYVKDWLQAQFDGKGPYSGLSEADRKLAGQALDDIKNSTSQSFEVWKYDVDRETGAVGNRRVADWDYPPGKKPPRLVFRTDEGKASRPRPKPKPPATGPPGKGDS